MSQNTTELVSRAENEYYSKVENLISSVKIYDFNSYTELNGEVSNIYLNTCSQLLGIVVNVITSEDNPFTFEKYIEKRAFLKKHNDSILDEIYSNNIQLFS